MEDAHQRNAQLLILVIYDIRMPSTKAGNRKWKGKRRTRTWSLSFGFFGTDRRSMRCRFLVLVVCADQRGEGEGGGGQAAKMIRKRGERTGRAR